MIGNIGTSELLLIFLVALLVFGAKRIPEIARGMGRGIREFKDAMQDIKKEISVEEHRQNYHIQPPSYTSTPSVTPPAPTVETTSSTQQTVDAPAQQIGQK